MHVTAKRAFYIKLGRGGIWEDECFREGILRFGYSDTPHELCIARDWAAIREFWTDLRGNAATATNDTRQIQAFYETSEEDLFITFARGLLHWCRPSGPVELLPDGGHLRSTAAGWSTSSSNGQMLSSDKISGNLLKVQMFRGTICQVKPFEYLLRKLNDELSPEVAAAEGAERTLMRAVEGLMHLLTWQDFELLVDLMFAASGWRRIGILGRTQKSVDLELVLPTTGERAFVQIKSKADSQTFQEYRSRFEHANIYARMFLVWHTGTLESNKVSDAITLISPDRLSKMVIDAGLSSWLREKVS
jgi:hypothetical protein